jgi:CBS domain containing-hemolysin-like protein
VGGGIILDGRLSVAEAAAALGIDLPEGEYDSLAGLLYARLGAVPRPGDEVDLDGTALIVDELDGHRITRVRVVLKQRPEEESTSE